MTYNKHILQYSVHIKSQLSRRHLTNSSDVFVIKGFTVVTQDRSTFKVNYTLNTGSLYLQ